MSSFHRDPKSGGDGPFGLRPRLLFAMIGSVASITAMMIALILLQRLAAGPNRKVLECFDW
jgi:hypothetical protein